MWREIATALCLMLIFEGIVPFLDPRGWQRTLVRVAQVHPGAVRMLALASMAIGLLLLHWIRTA